MQLNVSQQMKMSQQMKLAPRMIQSMEILQLPIVALQERIEQELQENVTLETGSADSEGNGEANEAELYETNTEGQDLEERELYVDSGGQNETDFERLLEMSTEWPEENVNSSSSQPSVNRINDEAEQKHDAIANISSRPQSLQDYLLEQFRFFNCSPEVRQFGEYLIQNLDPHGRLQSTLGEVVQVYGKPISREDAETALLLIQKLDPPGVGARDYKECLRLQVRPDSPGRELLLTLIDSHLQEVAQNRLPAIQRKTGHSLEEIKKAIEELQQLDPFPGRRFESEDVRRVTPDLVVEQDENGRYVVRLEEEYTPQLRISRRYRDLLRSNPDAKTRDYIKNKIDSAKWLIESIEQRNNTLRQVGQAIVDAQQAFLDNGPEYIVPLKMQEIADQVGVHVTTVSRAVDDKWIQTPRGLFPLKHFFGGGTQTAGGEEVAWDTVRLKLKEIVDNEDKTHPLSDDQLVEQMAHRGYNLARRTVTKYRKNLNIPSSRQRRVY